MFRLLFAVALVLSASRATCQPKTLEELVDTRHGAENPKGKVMSGRCLVGPCVPNGAISPGPDTLYPEGSKWPYPSPSGYHPGEAVSGFSQLHAHGTGGHPTYGLFLVSPTTGKGLTEAELASPMEITCARPSRFRCRLGKWNTDVAVTATRHAALYAFDFPEDGARRVVVNCARKIGKTKGLRKGGLSVDGKTVRGGGRYGDNWNPAEYDCFFAAAFDAEPQASGMNAEGTVAWFEFAERSVKMKLAVSFTSTDKAAGYLSAEIPSWDFARLADAAADEWNAALGTIRAEGFADERIRRVFYSNFYHTMIQPRDRTGDVPGWGADEQVWDDQYTIWDTWKTLYPLMSIVAPGRYASVVNSFAARLRHNGDCAASYIQTKEYRTGQSGDDVDNVIADAYAKRIPGIDWPAVAEVLKFHAAERTPDYLEKGYVCSDLKHPKYCYRFASGSGTLGFAYNDWCAANVLEGLGERDLAAKLRARSGNWTNVWDASVVDAPSGFRGFVRGKASDGRWIAKDRMNRERIGEFTPRQGFNSYFYEGTCWDYSFTVFNDIPGMIARMGGREKFVERLKYALENNLIEFGNEPSFMTIWMFDFAGRPDLCAQWASRLRERFDRWGDGWAVPGDDDSGAMGSLYVFLTAGFYPIAGTDLYALHGPSVKSLAFDLGGGKTFTVKATGKAGKDARFRRAVLNGKPLAEPFIRHADIVRGGVLEFEFEGEKAADWRPKTRWRGFNLCSMFSHGPKYDPKRPTPRFPEEDFKLIREWGFNFARLPIDYRWFTHGGNWTEIDESTLKSVDEAIELGRKHGVHVMLCLHRVPGYCINKCEEEPANLFESEEAKRVCEKYWRLFAKRYRGIPNDALTFNLMNEPPSIDDRTYGDVAKRLIDAIRAEDPERFIFSDGRCGGNAPTFSLVGMKGVAQSMRGYYPSSVSHYGASWVSTDWTTVPKPVWPPQGSLDAPAGILAGRGKSEMRRPFVLENLPAGELALRFGTVSGDGVLVARGDGQELGRFALRPRVGDPLWPKARLHEKWNIVQGRYAKQEKLRLPCPVKRLELLFEGDWCCLAEVAVESAGRRAVLIVRDGWGRPENFTQRFLGFEQPDSFAAVGARASRYADKGRETLWRKAFVEWRWGEMLKRGEFVMASEFGAYNRTPHAVALAWLEDNLRLWKEQNVPWALWNLRGSFGVLDSGRKDVEYEDFRGHKLDRKMLELLQRY